MLVERPARYARLVKWVILSDGLERAWCDMSPDSTWDSDYQIIIIRYDQNFPDSDGVAHPTPPHLVQSSSGEGSLNVGRGGMRKSALSGHFAGRLVRPRSEEDGVIVG